MCDVCCEYKLNLKHTVPHYLIFKGKAEARSSPSFAVHLEEEKKKRLNSGGGYNQTVELCYSIIYFH